MDDRDAEYDTAGVSCEEWVELLSQAGLCHNRERELVVGRLHKNTVVALKECEAPEDMDLDWDGFVKALVSVGKNLRRTPQAIANRLLWALDGWTYFGAAERELKACFNTFCYTLFARSRGHNPEVGETGWASETTALQLAGALTLLDDLHLFPVERLCAEHTEQRGRWQGRGCVRWPDFLRAIEALADANQASPTELLERLTQERELCARSLEERALRPAVPIEEVLANLRKAETGDPIDTGAGAAALRRQQTDP